MSEVFWADGRSDEFKEGYALGYHDGSKDDTSPILQDLIKELRGYRHRARNDMADYYEQRLREVQGE